MAPMKLVCFPEFDGNLWLSRDSPLLPGDITHAGSTLQRYFMCLGECLTITSQPTV